MIKVVRLLVAVIVAGCTSGPAPATPSPSAAPASLSPSASVSPRAALFRAPVEVATLQGAQGSLVVDDFNGDRNLDMACVNDDGSLSLLMGTGDGSFDAAVGLSGGEGPAAITAADIDLDGRHDIVLTHVGDADIGTGSDDIVVQLSKGDGTFDALVRPAGVNPQAVVVGDFDADQKPDLATANDGDNLSIFLGRGRRDLQGSAELPDRCAVLVGIAVSDFNGDGKPDLTTTNSLIGRGRGRRHRVDPVGSRRWHVRRPGCAQGRRSAADDAGGGRRGWRWLGGHPRAWRLSHEHCQRLARPRRRAVLSGHGVHDRRRSAHDRRG